MEHYDDLSPLIGKKILSSSVSEDKEQFILNLEGAKAILNAYGDCCSHSWFEHCDDVPIDATISEIYEKPLDSAGFFTSNTLQEAGWCDEKQEYLEEIQQYFYEFVTDKGVFTLEMRNESNGYYGGSIRLTMEENI